MSPERDDDERELAIEAVVGAWRERSGRGEVRPRPEWHDLDEAGRIEAYERTVTQRRLEAAADPQGLSTTAKAVLARIRGGA